MTHPAGEPSHDLEERLEKKLDDARRELLETSVRSRLLSTPLGSSRAKIVEICDEMSDQVFSLLVRDAKAMTFAASKRATDKAESLAGLGQPDEDESDPGRHTDKVLQTSLASDKLQTRLRGIAYDAATFESEQGINVLYLALGFLEWREAAKPDTPRFAPLILVPVTLTRSSASAQFKLAHTADELQTNLSLQERMKEEGVQLPDLADIEDLVPTEYAAAVATRISGLRDWSVHANRIALGLFSFARLMMYRDLDATLWPITSSPAKNPLIEALLDTGFGADPTDRVADDAPVDPIVDIADAGHVVEADSSQSIVINDISHGHHLVVQGPPGTGKSQTITNIIAGAVRAGKRVLFVAEKMAALDVVRSNLDKSGLADICLELHSHKAQKKVVLESLRETFEERVPRLPVEGQVKDDLRRSRDALNGHAQRMHVTIRPSSTTPFQIFGKLARLSGRGVTPPDDELRDAIGWSRVDAESRRELIVRLGSHAGAMGLPATHPWRGVGLDVVLPQDAQRFAARASEIRATLSQAMGSLAPLAERVQFPIATLDDIRRFLGFADVLGRAPDLDPSALAHDIWATQRSDISRLVAQGATFSRLKKKLAPVVRPEAWDADTAALRSELTQHGRSWLRWLRAEYRAAVERFTELIVGELPKSVAQRLEILESLAEGQRARAFIREHDATGRAAFGTHWKGEDSNWAALESIVEWLGSTDDIDLPADWRRRALDALPWRAFSQQLATIRATLATATSTLRSLFTDLGLDLTVAFGSSPLESISLTSLAERLGEWAHQPDRIREWATWRVWSREASEKQLEPMVARVYDGRLPAAAVADSFDYAYHEALARKVFADVPELAHFEGRRHDEVVEEFRRLDLQRTALARAEVLAAHGTAIPRGSGGIGEIGILAREWTKKSRHLPLRKLIREAGSVMQAIKPVWMMSPMSLAQYVEQGALSFALVVMDEASQVTPVDALGAIARAGQLVVVGDDKQLPPTAFFDRVAGDDETDDEEQDSEGFQVSDIESILGLCSAQGMPNRMLRWHYRSQHESLIAVSNLEFYRKLYIVPSASSEDLGLRLHLVNGVYDRGRAASNVIEARAVAKAVIDHAMKYGESGRYPDGMSLGVGTFSVAQRDAILDELELLRRQQPSLEGFFNASAAEPFFVKNLESIQGDERDVVFISIGYGPDEGGYMSMAFGPLNRSGGERRLNVLISRARRRCEVFSSITAADIDLARAPGAGVRVLKTFLKYAETGALDRSVLGDRPPDSDFEEDVGQALAALGYEVEHQVGVAGFWVDLAVKDPGRPGSYLLGIECDGASYHSSRSARDRDRIREKTLRDRGWRIHRIWSTDWFKSRSQELERAVAAITTAGNPQSAKRTSATTRKQAEIATEDSTDAPTPDSMPYASLETPAEGSPASAYVEASFVERVSVEPHELPLAQRVDIIARIVDIEAPIHRDEIARRFATVCGKQRAGGRISDAVDAALSKATRDRRLTRDDVFYSIGPVETCTPRDRSAARSVTVRNPDMIPPVEIRTAIVSVVKEHVGVSSDDAIMAATRLFGFHRTGAALSEVFEQQVRALLGDGQLELRNGNKLYVTEETGSL